MRKRVLSVILCLAMVLSMTIPAYAKPACTARKPVMVALGDSVGAGFGLSWDNGRHFAGEACNFVNEEGKAVTDGSGIYKNSDIHSTVGSYPDIVANKINADPERSYNATYNGFRPKDLCYALGLLSKDEESEYNQFYEIGTGEQFTYDIFTEHPQKLCSEKGSDIYQLERGNTTIQFEDRRECVMRAFNPVVGIPDLLETRVADKLADERNSCRLKTAIVDADVITIELGLNDFCAFLMNDAQGVIDDILKGINARDIIRTVPKVDKMLRKYISDSKKYLGRLVQYIRKMNPDANIVLVNMYNPMKGWYPCGSLKPMAVLFEAASLVMQPYLNMMSNNVCKIALRNRCKIANISGKVTAGRFRGTWSSYSGTIPDIVMQGLKSGEWFLHPDEKGQKTIGRIVYKAIHC